MISTACTGTPAGVTGPGALAVRPAPRAGMDGAALVVRPRHGTAAPVAVATPYQLTGTGLTGVTVAVQGTSLPTAGLLGINARRADVFSTDVFSADVFSADVFSADVFGTDTTDPTSIERTTLGIHSPRRPQS
ncbi:hypothetical protein [Geodermatophilus maliterrae]|uniref:Pentapeptide repeat-containing protein n=1 Tax=Geodermatophilus maliterrae TaxID=3162531 RepID=A0ABV3X8U3_9ACTN